MRLEIQVGKFKPFGLEAPNEMNNIVFCLALHIAANVGHRQVVQKLLFSAADVNLK